MDADDVSALIQHLPGWSGVCVSEVSITSLGDTEWHELYLVSVSPRCVVVNIPSWKNAELENKIAASRAISEAGLGPCFWPLEVNGRFILVSEYFDGGVLNVLDLSRSDGQVIAEVGRLFGRLHKLPTDWFHPVRACLVDEGLLKQDASSWASCFWILSWLQRLVPASNKTMLEAAGVDWTFIEQEIHNLPEDPVLPSDGVTRQIVTVHGDSHPGNIMWHQGSLRLIDFDMTSLGPAGSELGFLALMLFRCGFSEDAVLGRAAQRAFAAAYLEVVMPKHRVPEEIQSHSDPSNVDKLLLDMHRWSYVGMLKMGLLCAVLMENEGPEGKRKLMRQRGPVLLNPSFLKLAKDVVRRSLDGDSAVLDDLLQRGLFFATETCWQSTSAVKD